MNRIVTLACSLCLCILLLCACGGSSGSTDAISSTVSQSDPVTLADSSDRPVPETAAETDAGSDSDLIASAVPVDSPSGDILCATLWYSESGDAAWTFYANGTYTKEKVSATYSGTWTITDNGDQIQLSMTDKDDGITKSYQVTFQDDNTVDLLNSEGKTFRLTPFGT